MSASRAPTVEVLVGLRTDASVEPLVRALARYAAVRAPERSLAPPDARLATSTDAPGLRDALRDDTIPLAVALQHGEQPSAEVSERASALLLARRPESPGIPSFAAPVVAWPDPSVDAAAHPPLSPLVRRRWRRALGLPDELVVVIGFGPATRLPEAAIPSALATCDAAAVRGPWALIALALGTPLVTDDATARRIGARDEQEIALEAPGATSAAAHDLARDERRAARLGTAARRLAEQVHDVAPSAHAVARRLGLVRVPTPGALLQEHLAELGTPTGSPVALRARVACDPFLSLSGSGSPS
jgi:hypothetical protein